jgi:hypothetical protein
MKIRSVLLLLWAAGLPAYGEDAVPPPTAETAIPSGGNVVAAPLPDKLPPEARDPTKVSPRFEKTFRELNEETRPPGRPGGPAAAGSETLPDIRLLGRICHHEGSAGVAMLRVGDQIVHARADGEQTTVLHNGQPLLLRVDLIDESSVRLHVQPFNISLILH